MRLQHLHLILALSETGSLRAAALRLHVTQPALTKSLHQLEDEFGTAMVTRSPKGVRLTLAGELLAARAASAVRELDRAREEVAWQLKHEHARVTVGVSAAAALMLLPGAIARMRARWPQVQCRVVDAIYPRVLTMVRTGELDLAVGPIVLGAVGPDLQVAPLFDEQLIIIARSDHPLGKATRLAQLQGIAWIVTGSAGGPGDPACAGFERQGLTSCPVVLQCESFSTLVALMPSLDAVSIMPKDYFQKFVQNMGIVQLPIEDPLPIVTLHAIWRADAPLTVPASHLLDSLEQEALGLRRQAR